MGGPKQEGTPAFDDDELLYRRLIAAWVRPDGTVAGEAIEFAQTSVDRGKYTASARAALDRRTNTSEIAVAAVRFCELPVSFDPDGPLDPRAKNAPKAYELVVVYAPERGNDAHCHLETRQVGSAEARKPGGSMKSKIRDQIARQMHVVFSDTTALARA